jgi:O-acetylserine/cysteine efflux transporter
MKLRHILLALSVVLIWGFNYAVIAWGLRGMPPLLLAGLRFALAAFPLVFLRPRPRAPWPILAGHALCMFVLQFGCLFAGIRAGLPAGLASLVIQCQAFFTFGLAALHLGERPRSAQAGGAVIALAGLALVGLHAGAAGSFLGFALVLAAGLSWALGNLFTKRMGDVDVLSLVAWNSLLAAPVLLIAAWAQEGSAELARSLSALSWRSVAILLFLAYPATLFCFAAWSRLLHRYPANTVAPFSLLVPVFGMLSGILFLGESLTGWKLTAAVLVLVGLALNQAGARLARPMRRLQEEP